jgi:hypothetical protein
LRLALTVCPFVNSQKKRQNEVPFPHLPHKRSERSNRVFIWNSAFGMGKTMANRSLRSLLHQVFPFRRPEKRARRKGSAWPLAVEQLEARCLLSTLQAISLPPADQPPSDTAYLVTVHVDIGFGDTTALFLVTVRRTNQPPPQAHPLAARLVAVRVRKKKKTTRLMVQVFFLDTGSEKGEFRSPFQGRECKNIQVSVRDGNGDGVPDKVVLTARKGKRKLTYTVPA